MLNIIRNRSDGECCTAQPGFADLSVAAGDFSIARSVKRGEAVSLPSDPAHTVYYLEHGAVKAVRYSYTGAEVIIDQYQPGSLFGGMCFCEWSGCDAGIDREVPIALEDSTVVLTTFDALKKNLGCNSDSLLKLLADYCRRLAMARVRIEGLILDQAGERLAKTLLMLATQHGPNIDPVVLKGTMTHEEISSLIGVSRPFVTKLMGQLRDHGCIESLPSGQLLIHREKMARCFH